MKALRFILFFLTLFQKFYLKSSHRWDCAILGI